MKRAQLVHPAALFVLALVAITGFALRAGAAASGVQLPPPARDIPAGPEPTAVVVLAGGCFWGVQAVFQHLEGVISAVSGYAGGDAKMASYEMVSSGVTGHAEAVQVTYDPRRISYGRILQVFFSVAHNPTELNRQGPDVGSQYRTAIFPRTAEQAEIARAYIVQLDQAHAFARPIVTTIETDRPFFRAEAYHQDFLVRNPTYPYIVINDLPKVRDLKSFFPDLYRSEPVLVGG